MLSARLVFCLAAAVTGASADSMTTLTSTMATTTLISTTDTSMVTSTLTSTTETSTVTSTLTSTTETSTVTSTLTSTTATSTVTFTLTSTTATSTITSTTETSTLTTNTETATFTLTETGLTETTTTTETELTETTEQATATATATTSITGSATTSATSGTDSATPSATSGTRSTSTSAIASSTATPTATPTATSTATSTAAVTATVTGSSFTTGEGSEVVASARVQGSLTMGVTTDAEAQALAGDEGVVDGFRRVVAGAAGVPIERVEVTVRVLDARRLAAALRRRLAYAMLSVDYIIVVPANSVEEAATTSASLGAVMADASAEKLVKECNKQLAEVADGVAKVTEVAIEQPVADTVLRLATVTATSTTPRELLGVSTPEPGDFRSFARSGGASSIGLLVAAAALFASVQ